MPSLGRRMRAFTLLEAVVVLAIIGTLLGIAVLAWNGFRQQSQNIAGESLLGTAQTEMRAKAAANGMRFPELSAAGAVGDATRQKLVDGLFVDPSVASVFPESASGPEDFTVSVTQVPKTDTSPGLPNFIGYAVETNPNSCFTMLDRTVPGPGPSTVSAQTSNYQTCRVAASCLQLFAIDPEGPEFAAAAATGFTGECALPPPAPLEAPTCLIAETVDVADPNRTQDVVLRWTKPVGGDSPAYTYTVSRTEGELASADAAVKDPEINLLDTGFATASDSGTAATPAAAAGVEVTEWTGKGWQGTSSWLSTFPARQANNSSLVSSPPASVVAGEQYTFSVYLSTNPRSSSKVTVRPRIVFSDSSGQVLDTVSGSPLPLTGTWQKATATGSAPQGSTRAVVEVVLDTSTARLTSTSSVFSDGFMLNTGTKPADPAPRPSVTFDAGNPTGLTGSYTDTTAAPGVTYTYVVYAQSVATGERYPASDPITLATKPTSPTVTALTTNNAVTLVWGPVVGADSYTVTRTRYGQSGLTQVGEVSASDITGNGTLQFSDDEVTAGAAYTYRVTAVMEPKRLSVCGTIRRVGGPGAPDDITTGLPLAAPEVRATLTSTPVSATDEGRATVTWTEVGGEVAGYDLDFYNAEAGPSSTPQVLPQGTYPRRFAATANLTDSFANLGQGAATVYRARAVGEVIAPSTAVPAGLDLSSPWGSVQLSTPLVAPVLSVQMTDSTAGAGLQDDAVLSWDSNPSANSYAIEYLSSVTGTWAMLNPTVYTTTFTDTNVPAGTARTYRVRAERNIVGVTSVSVKSPWSNEVSVSVPIPAPTNVSCQVDNGDVFVGGDERVVVSWSGPANPYYLSSYYVTAWVDGSEYAYTTIPASSGVTSWAQTPPGPGTWSYSVYAVTPDGVSSAPASVGGCVVESPLPLPPPPPSPPCRPIFPDCANPTPPGPAPDDDGGNVVPQGGEFVFYKPQSTDPLVFTNYGRYTLKAQDNKISSVLLWLVDPSSSDPAKRTAPTLRGSTISRAPDKVVTSGLGSPQVLDAGASGALKWDALADKDPWTPTGDRAVYWVYALPTVGSYTNADAAANKLTVDPGKNATLFSDDASPVPDWSPDPNSISARAMYFFQPPVNKTKNVPTFNFPVPKYYQRQNLVKYTVTYRSAGTSLATFANDITALSDGLETFEYLPQYNPKARPGFGPPAFRDVSLLPNLGYAKQVKLNIAACAYYKTAAGVETKWFCGPPASVTDIPTGPRVPSVRPPDFGPLLGKQGYVIASWGDGGSLTDVTYRPTLNGVQPREWGEPFRFDTPYTNAFFYLNDFDASESRMYSFQVQAKYGQGTGANNDFPFDYVSPPTNTFFTRNPATLDDGAGEYVGVKNPYTGWTGSYEMALSVRIGLGSTGGPTSFLLQRTESTNTSNGQVWCMDLGYAAPGTDADALYQPKVYAILDGFTPSNSHLKPLKLSGMNASGGAIQPGSPEAYKLAYLLNNYGTPSSTTKDAITQGKAAAVDYALRELTRSGTWQRDTTDNIWKYVKGTNVGSYASTHYDRISRDARMYSGPYELKTTLYKCNRITPRSGSAAINPTCSSTFGTPIDPGGFLDTERTYKMVVKLVSSTGNNVPDGWTVTPYTTQGLQPIPVRAVDGKAEFTFIPIDADPYFSVGTVVIGPSPSVYARLPKDGVTSQRMLIGGVQEYIAETVTQYSVRPIYGN